MSDIIQSTPAPVLRETAVYVLMVRYGSSSWFPSSIVAESEKAREAFQIPDAATAWRWVRVDGLPIDVPKGEV